MFSYGLKFQPDLPDVGGGMAASTGIGLVASPILFSIGLSLEFVGIIIVVSARLLGDMHAAMLAKDLDRSLQTSGLLI